MKGGRVGGRENWDQLGGPGFTGGETGVERERGRGGGEREGGREGREG